MLETEVSGREGLEVRAKRRRRRRRKIMVIWKSRKSCIEGKEYEIIIVLFYAALIGVCVVPLL